MQSLWPTARGWILMSGSFLWFLIALTNSKILPFFFACAGFSLCLVSFCFALTSLRRITLERAPIGDGVTGKLVSMPVVITNQAMYPRQALLIVENCGFSAEPWLVTNVPGLKANEQRLVKRDILAQRRGKFKFDQLILRSGDPGGLFMREKSFSLPAQSMVVPGVEALPDLHLQPRHIISGAAGTPLSLSGGSQDIYAIREYSPGDGMRSIHWRSSARLGHLMVREFERNAIRSVAVVVDAQKELVSDTGPWSNLEYQIHAAASVCSHVAGLYCQLALGLGGIKPILIPSSSASEIENRILYHLALLTPGPVPLSEMIYQVGEMLSPETVLFCFSLDESPDVAKALEVLRLRGVTTRWFAANQEHFRGNKRHKGPESDSAESVTPSSRGAFSVYPGVTFGRILSHAT